MNSTDGTLGLLLAFIFIREIVHTIQVNKLMNKLMSRNYNDYEFSKNVSKTLEHKEQPFKEDTELPEDLAPVHGFGGLN